MAKDTYFTNFLSTLDKYNFEATPKMSVAEELQGRFDVLVDMNTYHTADKGVTMATFGLCGCIGGYIDNPDSNTFFHYDPLSVSMVDMLSHQHVSNATTKVHFFVPGEWQKGADGKYELAPKEEYSNIMLGATIERIKAMGVEYVFHCYNTMRGLGDDYMARSQGTAWIDKEGKLYSEGMPIQEISHPKSDNRNNPTQYL